MLFRSWPISHLRTILLKRYVFLYAFMFGVSISFPHLFLCSLNEVHKSYVVRHALIHPIFIYKILLFLGLADFPFGEPVHVVTPLGATFLRQRATHLRVNPSSPRGASSGDVPPPPSSTGADATETSVLLLLMLTFLHLLLRMILTFDVHWIMS